MTLRRCIAALAGLLALASPALAEGFPTGPIRFVVPFGAGSATDTVARVVGERVSAALGQPVIVEDVPGAGGMVAAQQVARAAPDGYTVLITTNTTHGAAQSLFRHVPYDAVADFAPLTRLGTTPLVMLVNADSPAKSVADFVALAKAQPGKLTFGSGSSSSRVCGELLKIRAGIDVVHVPYRSIPPAVMDLVGDRISMTFADPQTAMPQIAGGKARGLAVSGTSRIALAPDLPTMGEAGIADYDIIAYFAAFAPARTPAPVLDRLAGALRGAVADPATAARMNGLGITPSASTPAELGAQVASEIKKWAVLVKDAGIEPQ